MKKKEINDTEMKDRHMRSECGAKVVSGQEMIIEEVSQAITLEIEKSAEDPEYWPVQWRTHWVGLNMNRLALVLKMEDKPKDEAKELEFSVRMLHALEQVEKVFEEMEKHVFDVVCDRAGITKFTVRYQPKHWADEAKALTITGLALPVLMEDKGKEREYNDRVLVALNNVASVFLEAERFAFR